MTDFLSDVASYLAANGIGSITQPVSLFAGLLPATPDTAVGLIGNTGNKPNPYVPKLKFPRFQVLIRDVDYDNGAVTLDAIRSLLHGQFGLQLAHCHVLTVYADSDGGPLGQDTNGRHIFSINFQAELRDGLS